MNHKSKLTQYILMLLVMILPACSSRLKFVAPPIEPPPDLIPNYVPAEFELVSGFQLPGKVSWAGIFNSNEGNLDEQFGIGNLSFDLKSPEGNDILGVYYQGKDHILLITKSYYPDGTLDLWQAMLKASQPKFCDCEFGSLRLGGMPDPDRINEIQEVRTIAGTPVAIVKGPLGWTTVFIRGEYLTTVESGISLDENLKVVASLLEG